MDVNVLRSLVTVVSLMAFVGIVVWAWSSRNEGAFAEAAQLPFDEDGGAGGGRPTKAVTEGHAS